LEFWDGEGAVFDGRVVEKESKEGICVCGYRWQWNRYRGSKRKERDVMACIVKSVASFCRPSSLHLLSGIGS
jgi:hypothetical protein